MSVQHARIEWRDSEWVLVDLGSSNKLKVDGDRYGEVVLYPGLQVTVGSTTFEVLEKPRSERVKPDELEFTGSVEVPAETITWREILSSLVARLEAAKPTHPPTEIRPFPKTVKLEFISGVQHGTVWHLGYGPRVAGSNSFDLPLFDDAAAESCFLIETSEGKILMRSGSGAIVRLNGHVATTDPTELRSGDRIEFGKTRIRVLME